MAALHHRQPDVGAGDHLRHGAAEAVHRLHPQRHRPSHPQPAAQFSAGLLPMGCLGRFRGINAGQPNPERLPSLEHGDGVAVADREHGGGQLGLRAAHPARRRAALRTNAQRPQQARRQQNGGDLSSRQRGRQAGQEHPGSLAGRRCMAAASAA